MFACYDYQCSAEPERDKKKSFVYVFCKSVTSLTTFCTEYYTVFENSYLNNKFYNHITNFFPNSPFCMKGTLIQASTGYNNINCIVCITKHLLSTEAEGICLNY